jgi:hypothetical protein
VAAVLAGPLVFLTAVFSAAAHSRYDIAYTQVKVFEQMWYRDMLAMVCVVHIVTIAFFGTVSRSNESLISWVLFFLYFTHVLEISLRIASFGWREFWDYNQLHQGLRNKFTQLTNRFDFVLLILMGIGFVVAWFLGNGDISVSGSAQVRYASCPCTSPCVLSVCVEY